MRRSTATSLQNLPLGQIEPALLVRIRGLSLDKLDVLTDALLDFSDISDLVDWLENNTSS